MPFSLHLLFPTAACSFPRSMDSTTLWSFWLGFQGSTSWDSCLCDAIPTVWLLKNIPAQTCCQEEQQWWDVPQRLSYERLKSGSLSLWCFSLALWVTILGLLSGETNVTRNWRWSLYQQPVKSWILQQVGKDWVLAATSWVRLKRILFCLVHLCKDWSPRGLLTTASWKTLSWTPETLKTCIKKYYF